MDRRKFIHAGAAVATLAVAEQGVAAVAKSAPSFGGSPVAQRPPARFAAGYHSGLATGFWMDAMARPYESVPGRVNVFLLGVQGSASPAAANPLVRFNLDLLFKLDTTATAPYRWATLTRNGGLVTSKAITHNLLPSRIAGLGVSSDYRSNGSKTSAESQSMPLTSMSLPLLTPGFYVVVGPQATTGLPPSWGMLARPVANRCLVSRCDSRENDFDAILFAVEPAHA
jgi:hypothetical protein